MTYDGEITTVERPLTLYVSVFDCKNRSVSLEIKEYRTFYSILYSVHERIMDVSDSQSSKIVGSYVEIIINIETFVFTNL